MLALLSSTSFKTLISISSLVAKDFRYFLCLVFGVSVAITAGMRPCLAGSVDGDVISSSTLQYKCLKLRVGAVLSVVH